MAMHPPRHPRPDCCREDRQPELAFRSRRAQALSDLINDHHRSSPIKRTDEDGSAARGMDATPNKSLEILFQERRSSAV